MTTFEQTSRPVIFESSDPDYQYWAKGSSVLLANSRHYYWATAAHVMRNIGGSAESLRIFPSDDSKISLPFNEQYSVKREESDDEEHKDVIMLRIDLSEFDASGDAPLAAQDLDRGVLHAERLKPGDELWIIGYPAQSNFIDYEAAAIRSTRSVLRALYTGVSISDHCHSLSVDTSIQLNSYDGLSGSPIFYMKYEWLKGELVCFPLFVGMLLRGTASSRVAHFVSSSVLINIVRVAESAA